MRDNELLDLYSDDLIGSYELRMSTQTNHFALKARIYTQALQTAFDALRQLQPLRLAA